MSILVVFSQEERSSHFEQLIGDLLELTFIDLEWGIELTRVHFGIHFSVVHIKYFLPKEKKVPFLYPLFPSVPRSIISLQTCRISLVDMSCIEYSCKILQILSSAPFNTLLRSRPHDLNPRLFRMAFHSGFSFWWIISESVTGINSYDWFLLPI